MRLAADHHDGARTRSNAAVLSIAALIVLAALGAIGVLVLAVWERLSPSRPWHPARRATPVSERHPRRSSRPRHAVDARHPRRLERPAEHPREAIVSRATPAATAAARDEAAGRQPVCVSRSLGGGRPAAAAVDECFELYQAKRFDAVIAKALAALAAAPVSSPPAERRRNAAALWSIVALAYESLGDDAGAGAALQHAIASAPPSERATYERQLAALSLSVGQAALARATTQASADSEARVAAIREAVTCLERGMEATPNDAAVRDLAATARTLLWPAYEQVALALVQRQEFRAARRLLREALADPAVPEARAATYRELISGTYGGEVGQLTAQAIRSMQGARERDALGALGRAEQLLEAVAGSPLPPKRREEVDRRLWWGYKKLGLRCLLAGEYGAAIEPLTAALRFADGSPERVADTRAALVRAYEGVVASRVLAIRNVADAGDREAAIVQADKLGALLRAAAECGLDEADLTAASARVRRLLQDLASA